MVKIAQSSIELYHFEQNASKDAEDDSFSSFWSAIETMSHIKVISKQLDHDELVVKQVKQLMSYKNSKIGWTMLIQGRRVIIIADGWTMNRVLGRYDWFDEDFGDDMMDLMRCKVTGGRFTNTIDF
ncbi:PREDICTED: SIEVE ELEMENT OCCLUSION B [Prunus dulcis]|uniref:PREDICTED: SIEVE ELEMENT OCCLUSION B n=1 Tax=Prunus dulcis TaxID=3755 RepID=A0A5E4G2Z0_PRUDU|nr:PREDICTED: SIEVE ELEMENT OCCLUSION B [Prunus dulcis]